MSRETYSAILERAADGGYGVTFPLFPGCVSYGRTRKEAQANATEALELHIAGMAEDGETIPYEEPDAEDGIIEHAAGGVEGDKWPIFVVVEMGDLGGERVNVYLPKRLLSLADKFATDNGMTRSSVFGIALRRYVATETAPKHRHMVFRQVTEPKAGAVTMFDVNVLHEALESLRELSSDGERVSVWAKELSLPEDRILEAAGRISASLAEKPQRN